MFEDLLNKKITFFLKNKKVFSGTVLSVNDKFIKINDRFDGEKYISLDSIEDTKKWDG